MADIFDRKSYRQELYVCEAVGELARHMQKKLDEREHYGNDFAMHEPYKLCSMAVYELAEFEEGGYPWDEAADVANYVMFAAWLAEKRKGQK